MVDGIKYILPEPVSALFLKVNPMGKGIVQELSTGDETIIASQNAQNTG